MAQSRFKFLWVFASCLSIIVWAFADQWAPHVFGAERYARLAGSGVAAAIVIPFIKPMLSFFVGLQNPRAERL